MRAISLVPRLMLRPQDCIAQDCRTPCPQVFMARRSPWTCGWFGPDSIIPAHEHLRTRCSTILRLDHAMQIVRDRHRTGVTILEVLFAIAIVIVGILGIASILPLAGRQAGDSNRASIAQALGESWYREFMTRGMYHTGSWQRYQDRLPFGFQPVFKSASIPVGALLSKTSPPNFRPTGKQAVCIDPMFYSDRDMPAALAIGTSTWYRPSVFPYYQESYNPTIDPAYSINNPPINSAAWDDQPRMLRLTLGSLINAKMVEQIFQSQDDMVISADEKELDASPVRGIQFYQAPTTAIPLPFARAQAKTEYSWLATLTPTEQSDNSVETHYTMSIVVIHRRDTLFSPSGITERTPGTDPTPDDKPGGERLVWVLPLSGNFDGGHGGRVQLIATDGVKDDLQIGDWIMLSRHVGARVDVTGPSQQRYSVFRWYRVVGVDGEASYGPYNPDANGKPTPDIFGVTPPDNVWTRNVVLEGPDWNFAPVAPVLNLPGNQTFIAPTTATIVKGATHVIERVVEIP